jgi:threonine dehydrogenase-like Zn-dependent dehydrogenase
LCSRLPRLVDQEHRDVVAHGVGQAAVRPGAHQLAGGLIHAQRCVALRAGENVEQPVVARSRRESRQKVALEFGATDIVTERGDAGVTAIKDLTGGLGAHSVIEAVGTQESMMQAIRSTRPGGHVGYVGVSHGVELPGQDLFFSAVHLHGGLPRCAVSCPS